MRKLVYLSVALALAPFAAAAQVDVQIHAAIPAPPPVRLEIGVPVAPPLVVVSPGVQVVPDVEEEIFFVNRWYWVRRDGVWFRARNPRAQFVFVEPRYVPGSIVRIPPGQYRRWHNEDRKAFKAEEKAERKAWKEHEKEERKEWKHEHGHGKHGRD